MKRYIATDIPKLWRFYNISRGHHDIARVEPGQSLTGFCFSSIWRSKGDRGGHGKAEESTKAETTQG